MVRFVFFELSFHNWNVVFSSLLRARSSLTLPYASITPLRPRKKVIFTWGSMTLAVQTNPRWRRVSTHSVLEWRYSYSPP